MYYRPEFFAGPQGDITEVDTQLNQHLAKGYDFIIDKTWNGKATGHDPIKISMRWHFERFEGKPPKRVIKTRIEAPLFDDPEPSIEGPGHCADLYNYECVEFFFANEKGQYLEIEVGPHGNWLVLLFNGYRECFNKGADLDLDVENQFVDDKWICNLEIPLAYLPGAVTRFNAYALHGLDPERHYEALSPVTDGSLTAPDFHKTEYFIQFDTRRVIPQGYNKQPFNDLKYGDMWESVNEKPE